MPGASRPRPLIPRLDPELEESVGLGVVSAAPVGIAPSSPGLVAEIEETCSILAERHRGKSPGEIHGLAPARELYRSFGVDPTRTRPSSEALLRRVLQRKPWPWVSNAVDLCNLCSLRFLLPLGLYDAGRIRGDVSLRRGAPAEAYPGIRKEDVHLEGRLVLADECGPFGNPSSDSLRTSVGSSTRSIWMVIFAPANFPRDLLEAHVGTAREGMLRHLAPAGEMLEVAGAVVP